MAIYLKEPACDRLYRNLWRALRPGGYLFVGTSERLFAMKEIGFESVSPCFYRKVSA
jgi:chemotaxis protein methyltransferase CheR